MNFRLTLYWLSPDRGCAEQSAVQIVNPAAMSKQFRKRFSLSHISPDLRQVTKSFSAGACGCLSVFGINITVGVEHARPILLMCRNYCRLLEGSRMLAPYNENHPEPGYAPSACFEPAFTGLAWYTG